MKILIKSLLGLLIVSSALVLIAAGLLHGWVVPHMDDLRPRMETYLSDKTGHNVQIGNITAESSGFLPSFDLKDVLILDDQHTPLLTLGRVQVDVSPLSLLTLEIDRLTIDAPTLEMVRDVTGQITVAGFKIGSQGTSSKASDWIFSQKEIVIRDGTLHWTDAKPHLFGQSDPLPTATLKRVVITLKNGLRSHSMHLQATPPEGWGQTFSVTGKFTQPLLEVHAGRWQVWTGAIDAQVKNIPALASQIKVHLDWPLRDVTLEGEQLVLASLTKLAQSAGQALPQDPALSAALTGLVPRFKLQAKDVPTDKLQVHLEAKLANSDLSGDVEATWKKEGQKIDATVNMAHIDLAALHRYVPERAPLAVRQTLQNAIQKGTASDVRITVRGALKDIPFANNQAGELRITGKVSDAQFTIPQKADAVKAPWTSLMQTGFSFALNGSQLDIKNIATEVAGLTSKGSVRIADIRKPVLEARVELAGKLADVLAIVRAEPLKTITKDAFATSEATGNITSTLQLSLPLATPSQTKVTGQAQLLGNDFVFNVVTPAISAMKGKINFTQAGFQLDNLRGMTLGGELKLSGNGQKMVGSGTFSAEGLAAWPRMPMRAQLAPRLHGRAPYTFSLEPRTGGTGLVLESTLVGLQIDLPTPLAKTAASTWTLRVQQAKTTTAQDRLTFTLGDVLAGDFVRDISAGLGKPAPALRGSLLVGPGSHLNDLVMPEQGVNAFLKLEQLDVALWSTALALDKLDSNPSGTLNAAASYIPSQIAAQIDTLKFANRNFTQVVLGASKSGRTWRINANANDFNGYGEYRPPSADLTGQVYLRLVKLVVPDANSKSQIEQLLQTAPDRIPAVDVIVDDFEVTGKKVGRIEMLAVNQRSQGYLGTGPAQEWRLQKLNITNPDATLKATGVWLPSNEVTNELSNKRRVDVQFNLDVTDSGALLTRFGLPGTIKAGKGSLQGRFAWVGSPWALHLPTLAGQLKMDMSKGQFLKIEPGRAGRFFNVLSLQALPRLLTLDFRDVFSEGFAFDSLSGDAQINDGIFNSKNLQMKSVLALVSMDGSVDLVKETQNLHVLVLPDINAGGASLIATLINPVVGAATYLAQLVLRRPVIAAATKEYSIQGSWQEPKITPLKQGVPLPAPTTPTTPAASIP